MGEQTAPVAPIKEETLEALCARLKNEQNLDEVVAVETKKHGFAVFRAPSQEEYERFQNGIRRSDSSHQRKKTTESLVIRQFVAATMIYPTGEAITDLLRKLPALPAVVADKICELVGADDEFDVKKL